MIWFHDSFLLMIGWRGRMTYPASLEKFAN
jgi:hypothetical protein